MKILDYSFAAIFALLGFTALIGALFFGATWHYGTTFMCVIFSGLFINDSKKEHHA